MLTDYLLDSVAKDAGWKSWGYAQAHGKADLIREIAEERRTGKVTNTSYNPQASKYHTFTRSLSGDGPYLKKGDIFSETPAGRKEELSRRKHK